MWFDTILWLVAVMAFIVVEAATTALVSVWFAVGAAAAMLAFPGVYLLRQGMAFGCGLLTVAFALYLARFVKHNRILGLVLAGIVVSSAASALAVPRSFRTSRVSSFTASVSILSLFRIRQLQSLYHSFPPGTTVLSGRNTEKIPVEIWRGTGCCGWHAFQTRKTGEMTPRFFVYSFRISATISTDGPFPSRPFRITPLRCRRYT